MFIVFVYVYTCLQYSDYVESAGQDDPPIIQQNFEDLRANQKLILDSRINLLSQIR